MLQAVLHNALSRFHHCAVLACFADCCFFETTQHQGHVAAFGHEAMDCGLLSTGNLPSFGFIRITEQPEDGIAVAQEVVYQEGDLLRFPEELRIKETIHRKTKADGSMRMKRINGTLLLSLVEALQLAARGEIFESRLHKRQKPRPTAESEVQDDRRCKDRHRNAKGPTPRVSGCCCQQAHCKPKTGSQLPIWQFEHHQVCRNHQETHPIHP
mmetsp:Transcript_26319/g.57583  ORF Transcript_26319/g.57583 Transcript_26319/m.57583 type:complete len:212 (+) Transcript_26319:388-1023(+)